jgi:hypothetical protein
LLKPSLGGNSFTLMIACLAPSDYYMEENLSTLNYASLAKRISNTASVNEDPKTRLIRLLRKQVKFLKEQLARAQQVLVLDDGQAPVDNMSGAIPSVACVYLFGFLSSIVLLCEHRLSSAAQQRRCFRILGVLGASVLLPVRSRRSFSSRLATAPRRQFVVAFGGYVSDGGCVVSAVRHEQCRQQRAGKAGRLGQGHQSAAGGQ